MTEPPSSIPDSSDDQPIDQHPAFRDWAAFVKLRNDVGSIYDKRAVEAQKISSEFSKLIIINLQFINAGGLLAVPSLASTLLGLSNLNRSEKLQYLGTPMLMFAAGLLLASLCSYYTYKNYRSVAAFYDAQRRSMEEDVGRVNPRMWPRFADEIEAKIALCEGVRRNEEANINVTFIYSYGCGFGSIACFITACCFLAAFVR